MPGGTKAASQLAGIQRGEDGKFDVAVSSRGQRERVRVRCSPSRTAARPGGLR